MDDLRMRDLVLYVPTGGLLLLFLIAGCTGMNNRNHELDPKVTDLMAKLRNGDAQAVADLVSLGTASYQPLAKELQQPTNGASEWLALQALSQLNDKRVILLLARKYLESESTSGELNAYLFSYLESVVGTSFNTLAEYERWYNEHKDKLMWDDSKRRFVVSK